jgi:multidrug efflux pump
MVVLMVLGFAAYFQLGQDEDPPFTFRAMVVRTYWPGATAQQVAEQVTDKLERTLQEVPYATRSAATRSRASRRSSSRSRTRRKSATWPTSGTRCARRSATCAARCRSGVQGPFFNDDFGDVYGVIYALETDGYSYAEIKTFADDVRQQLLRVQGRGQGRTVRRAGREAVRRDLAEAPGAAGPGPQPGAGQLGAAERGRERRRHADAAGRGAGARGRPVHGVEQLREMPIRGTRATSCGWATSPRSGAATVDPPQVKVHHQGKEVVALGVSMAKGGDIIRAGQGAAVAVPPHRGQACRPVWCWCRCRTSRAVATSVNEFVRTLIEAVVIVLAVSFIALGLHKRPGAAALPLGSATSTCGPAWWWHHHPAGAGRDLPGDGLLGHRPAQDLAGLADHRAGPAGGRRDHRGRDDGAQDGGGLRQGRAPPPSPTT